MEISFGKLTQILRQNGNISSDVIGSELANIFTDNNFSVQNKQNLILSPKELAENLKFLQNGYIEKNENRETGLPSLVPDLDTIRQSVIEKIQNGVSEEALKAADEALNINGELDEQVKQQGTGDCYFLTTLNALNNTNAGKEIISNCISHDEENQIYTVTFPGINKSFSFNAAEILEADEKKHDLLKEDGSRVHGEGNGWYSEGDDDAMLLEMAFEKFRSNLADGKYDNESWAKYVKDTGNYDGTDENVSPLESGSMDQVMYLFTGEKAKTAQNGFFSPNKMHNALDKIKNDTDGDYVVYAAIRGSNGFTQSADGDYYLTDSGSYKKVDENTPDSAQRYSFSGAGSTVSDKIVLNGVGQSEGDSIKITNSSDGGHSLAITNITEDTVTIINPWDSEHKVTVNREDFEQYMFSVQYMDVSKLSNHSGGGHKF